MQHTLYRSGSITPLNKIWNQNAEAFENLIIAHGGEHTYRTSSVYASLDLNDVIECWYAWREDKELDSDIYIITLPEGITDVYAYNINHYEDYVSASTQCRTEDAAEAAMAYYTNRVHITEWVNIERPQDYEILIPYHIAEESEWVNLD